MQAEMNKLFAEGGVMQQGGTVDPVSGNEVPPGAMQEEVRDDIDAKLSEGEFVIPADVVRYIGLEKLMALRDKAKAGLKRMEEIGQMGNAEEVPDGEALFGEGEQEDEMDDDAFSSEIDSIMSEDGGGGEEREYAKGGDVRKYAPGGYVGGEASEQLYRDAPIRGFEMVPMTNDAGQTIFIPFINGVAQLNIPAGYKVKKAGVEEKPVEAAAKTQPSGDGGGGGGDGTPTSGGGVGSLGIDDAGLATGVSVSPTAVGLVGAVMGALGIPGATAVSLGKGFIAQSLSNASNAAAASANQAAMAAQMGLTPAEAATTTGIAATASAVDSLSSSPTGTVAATPGAAGTGGSAASAAADAAATAAAAGMSAEAQGAASQAAADAAIGGASSAAAAAAGAAAAAAADNGPAAEGGNTAANAAASAASVGDTSSTSGEANADSSGDASGDSGVWAKGGFVSKPKKTKSKSKGLAGRR